MINKSLCLYLGADWQSEKASTYHQHKNIPDCFPLICYICYSFYFLICFVFSYFYHSKMPPYTELSSGRAATWSFFLHTTPPLRHTCVAIPSSSFKSMLTGHCLHEAHAKHSMLKAALLLSPLLPISSNCSGVSVTSSSTLSLFVIPYLCLPCGSVLSQRISSSRQRLLFL